MFDHFFIIMHERGNISYKQQYKQLICTKDQQNSLIKNQKKRKKNKEKKPKHRLKTKFLFLVNTS